MTMHTFIILGDDIYTLDTVAERTLAAEHMRDAGIAQCPVYRGDPEGNEAPEGRDFCSDGTWAFDGDDERCAFHRAGGEGRCNSCEESGNDE